MPDFSDIALEYERIKDTPEVIDNLRTNDQNKTNGQTADNQDICQNVLPDEKTHYKMQDKLSTMFDKSSRSGAKSTLHGLILPNGRKMFAEFHDKYTGTGRFKPQTKPETVALPKNGKRLDTPRVAVALYERCMQCLDRVSKDDAVPNIYYIPPGELLTPIGKAKWQTVDLKPGMVIGYLFCSKCPDETMKEVKRILHDPFKSALMLPAPGGKQQSLAEIEARKYMQERTNKITDNVIMTIKRERDNPDSDVFYGDAII